MDLVSEKLGPEELEEVTLHVASHAACALLLGRPVAHIEVKRERVPAGEVAGECQVPIGAAGLCVSQLRLR
jgi:porphobilinogen deaminase